jgi:DNA-binding CsgD family transcriptional regulator
MRTPTALRVNGGTAAETNESLPKKKAPPPKSRTGFLLLDCSLSLMSFNVEAVQILGYPDEIGQLTNSDVLLTQKIRSSLVGQPSPDQSVFVTEFRSGRRHYFCRAFVVDAHSKDPSLPSIAVLLERGPSGLIPMSQVSQQFNLTQREEEALTYLLQGLSTKGIANRMNVSPNTVKAFLRLIMIKIGVSSRSALVGKIVMTQS